MTLAQITKDFGVSDQTLADWMSQADIEEGRRPGRTKDEAAEVRELLGEEQDPPRALGPVALVGGADRTTRRKADGPQRYSAGFSPTGSGVVRAR